MHRKSSVWMFQYLQDNIQAQYSDNIEMTVYGDLLLLPHVINQW